MVPFQPFGCWLLLNAHPVTLPRRLKQRTGSGTGSLMPGQILPSVSCRGTRATFFPQSRAGDEAQKMHTADTALPSQPGVWGKSERGHDEGLGEGSGHKKWDLTLAEGNHQAEAWSRAGVPKTPVKWPWLASHTSVHIPCPVPRLVWALLSSKTGAMKILMPRPLQTLISPQGTPQPEPWLPLISTQPVIRYLCPAQSPSFLGLAQTMLLASASKPLS